MNPQYTFLYFRGHTLMVKLCHELLKYRITSASISYDKPSSEYCMVLEADIERVQAFFSLVRMPEARYIRIIKNP